MTEIHRRDSPEYRDMRTNEQRLMIGPHVEQQTNGERSIVLPARAMVLGQVRPEGQTDFSCAITVYSLFGASGLMFVPNVEELEALGNEMLNQARIMRERADQQAKDAIERALRR